jgi:hypothetical protein
VLIFGATYESGEGHEVANNAIQKIDPILISAGLCPVNKEECLDKDTMWTRGIKGGEQFEIYGINDQKLLNNIVQIISDEWRNNSQLQRIEIISYPYPKAEEGKYTSLLSQRPINLKLELRRSQ